MAQDDAEWSQARGILNFALLQRFAWSLSLNASTEMNAHPFTIQHVCKQTKGNKFDSLLLRLVQSSFIWLHNLRTKSTIDILFYNKIVGKVV